MRLLSFAAVLILGCGRTEVVRYSLDASVDAGPFDAGLPDAGRPDAGPPDAGEPDAGPPDAGPCLPRPLPLVPALPTAMFVIDRSGSMLWDLDGNDDGGMTRWDVLEASLRSVLPPLDQKIATGVLMYPVQSDSCVAPTTIDLSPALGNVNRLLGLFSSTAPLGGTPTAEALTLAANHLRTLRTATSARAVILATDGAPNCNGALMRTSCVCTSPPAGPSNCDSASHCLDDRRTFDALRGLFSMGLPTYVIGIGSSLNQFASTLDQMAVAGGVPRMGIGPRYYSVANQTELTDAFSRITAQLTRCTFLLNGLTLNDTFAVQVDGVDVPQGPDGWEWLDQANGELRLHGLACDRAAAGSVASVLVDCH
ncbi:MAG: VWA domain-containing protein [Archangium sp.]|nr:VWA domain-containing protein [Archangium sp.]MDP3571369.1 VWA domain-containing protein [Archangium sp.]